MNRLFPTLLLCIAANHGNAALAAPPLFAGPQPFRDQQDGGDTLRLRELRLKEAIDRGELSPEEARRLRQFYRRHEAVRPFPPASGLDNPPDGQQEGKGWRRWRKKQDRLNAQPFAAPD
ncbi:hypothetical protein [Vogesella oryzae]|uniref:hypothetical protein n=1 Tax=Vogesella oryzae TaxID=1735285 RepID=UPI0015838DBF|nr:hypothetical protein [Vogesella oryzae]